MMSAPCTQLWTIGHSTRSLEEFISLLHANKIQAVADVRRFPASRRHPHFNEKPLSESLNRAGLDYFHFSALGGRRAPRPDSPNTIWHNPQFRGYADYMITGDFLVGIKRPLLLAEAKRTAIMCAEAVWRRCHRSLIADHLKAAGNIVLHILGEAKIEEHPFIAPARAEAHQLGLTS